MNWNDIWMSIGQILAGIFIGIAALGIKKIKKYIKKKTLDRSINENMMLKQLLAEIKSYYDADRVQLYQFHNGEHYVSGGSIQKISMTHFVAARGVSVPFEATHQNIPIGYVLNVTDEILKKSQVFYSQELLLEDSYFKGLLRYGGARSALLRGIFSDKHSMIGFIVISWFENITPTKEQQANIKEFSMQLADEMLLGAKSD